MARRVATRKPKPRVLIVCEGAKTEPEYLKGFERWQQNLPVVMKVLGEGKTPSVVVDRAVQERDEKQRLAQRTNDAYLAYDCVWCVVDHDQHHDLNRAIATAQQENIQLAISNPCFELWLLLHFEDCVGSKNARQVRHLLEKHHAGYRKSVDFRKYQQGYHEAVERAQRMDQHAATPGQNPSTRVDRLTEYVRGSVAQDGSNN